MIDRSSIDNGRPQAFQLDGLRPSLCPYIIQPPQTVKNLARRYGKEWPARSVETCRNAIAIREGLA